MKFNVQDLIDRGLVKAKEYDNGLKVLKYDRKVFFKNLWHLDERLLECRGRVVDSDWNVIVNPFKKVFNYGENGTGNELRTDCLYREVHKLNGFLGLVTYTEEYGMLYSTTGTLDSTYAGMVKEMFLERVSEIRMRTIKDNPNFTMMFEVCHQDDPHIVPENVGLYLIGCRHTGLGEEHEEDQFTEAELDKLAVHMGWRRPKHKLDTLDNILARAKTSKTEGVMVCSALNDEHLFKYKTPHYLSKKLLMRLGKARVEQLFDNPEQFKKNLKDEEFFGFVEYVSSNIPRDVWKTMKDQERRNLIECWFDKNNAF
ncbi:putative RNA ligase/tail attachment protein [Vibrio phage River4]|uniref:Putative RNA ligase/tail attachment protein n=1 Tax=Vibrio phage River4 TaxID=2736288 RepID=A0A6M9Z202_9CAUD|nr:putative RNA ligase/tail attachment protein [Vibrio phage River4]QKN84810.1 putative RNA ligase/tail attachment protein [Vibrio phage River4]